MKMPSSDTGEVFVLNADQPALIRNVNERLVSYNIEMTEITGGTFWKSYTPGQIAGTEEFPAVGPLRDVTSMPDLTQYYPPIDLYHDRLRGLAKKLGPAWVRVSGTWATKTYYDFDDATSGKAPAGYASVLTREQWIGVLDFVRYVGAKFLISVSNCAGDHPDGGPLDLTQAKKIFDFSHGYGVEIDAVEFMNEPNMLEMSGSPAGYTAADYARDQDILYTWVRANYPNCLLVGPCTTGDLTAVSKEGRGFGAGIGSLANVCTTEELLAGTTVKLDVFSYHYYNGISERLASVMPRAHWPAELAHTDEYLAVAPDCASAHAALRDRFVPGGQIWVTESGDAGGGGNTWASTYLDVLRTLNELGSYGTITDGIIFHNTLASSDYGFLDHGSFLPRPNYFAVLLWNQLMGAPSTAVSSPTGRSSTSTAVPARTERPEWYTWSSTTPLPKTPPWRCPERRCAICCTPTPCVRRPYALTARSCLSPASVIFLSWLRSGSCPVPCCSPPGSCTFSVL